MIDIYSVFTFAISFLSTVCLVFLFIERKETFGIVIRLICAFAIVVIEAFKMPMDIAMNKSCAHAILAIIIWLVNVVIASGQLKRD